MRTEDTPNEAHRTDEDYLPYDALQERGVEAETVTSPAAAQPNFVEGGVTSFRSMLKEASAYGEIKRTPYGMRPVLLIMVLGTVSAFDATIFPLATPEIIRDLDIDLVTLNSVFALISVVVALSSIGVAYMGDRWRRVWIQAGGALLQGIASCLTPFARSITAFGATRAGDTVGDRVLDTVRASLLADYYPPESRGKVFAFSGVFARSAALSAPLTVAWLATATGLTWRLPFMITGPALLLSAILAFLLLREPIRGYIERKSLGASEEVANKAEETPSFGEAWRTIWSIRTIRRLFVADIPASVGEATFIGFFNVYLSETYHLSITQRALLATVLGVVTIPFGILAGGLVDVLLRRRPQRVLVLTGGLGAVAGVAIFFLGLKPPLWVLIAIAIAFSAASSLLGPARGVLFVQILPAHVRTLGGSMFALTLVPAALLRVIVIGAVASRWGVQGVILVGAPFFFVSGLIAMSSAGFFERDMRAAMASQLAAEEYRRARETGHGKLLVCRHVDVEYDGVQVLFGVDFDVEEGEVIALLGTNGAGKSTLLRAISGSQEASGGAIVLDGRDITHMPPHEIAARGAILMPGGRGLFPGLSVRENLLLGTWTLADDYERQERLQQVYEMFPILTERIDMRAGTLSGGEQQMLSLAQAFLNNPKCLMIDELSLGLSPAVVAQLLEAVRAINATGTTIIVVEQSVNIALTIANRAIFMEKGEVKFVGKTADLLHRPDILRAIYVKGTGGAGGAQVRSPRRVRELEQAQPVLEVEGLVKRYGGITAVDGVSFSVRDSEVLGLIGPNGAGKTTVFDLISGYQIPDEGTVRLLGEDVTKLDPEQRARKGLVRRFQDARMFPPLTVFENLLVALEMQLDVRSTLLNAAQMPQARRAEKRIRVRAERLIELLELGSYRDKFVKELSTGLKRIVDLACVLAAEPKVLLLDEPSSGIAQAEAESLAPLLRRVRYETGCSLLIIEHDMPLISKVSDELLALELGRTVVRGTPEEVLNDERVVSSYLGGDEAAVQRSGIRPDAGGVRAPEALDERDDDLPEMMGEVDAGPRPRSRKPTTAAQREARSKRDQRGA